MIWKINLIIQFISILKRKLIGLKKTLSPNQNVILLNHMTSNISIDKHLNMFGNKRKFLFRCEKCALILAVEIEDEEDLKQIENNKLVLECPCGGICRVLRD